MLRKGQHLFNKIAEKHELLSSVIHITNYDAKENPSKQTMDFPYYNLHKILYYMSDKEFDSMMTSLTDGDGK